MQNFKEIQQLTNEQLLALMSDITKGHYYGLKSDADTLLGQVYMTLKQNYGEQLPLNIDFIVNSIYQEIAWRTYDGRWNPVNIEGVLQTLSGGEIGSLVALIETLTDEDIEKATREYIVLKVSSIFENSKARASLSQALRFLKATNIIICESRGHQGTVVRIINKEAFLSLCTRLRKKEIQ